MKLPLDARRRAGEGKRIVRVETIEKCKLFDMANRRWIYAEASSLFAIMCGEALHNSQSRR